MLRAGVTAQLGRPATAVKASRGGYRAALSDKPFLLLAATCMLACDGLKGLPDAVSAVWEKTIVQTCIVHYPDTAVMPIPAGWCWRAGVPGPGISA